VEEQRTNLIPYSAELNNAAWIKENVSVYPNATVAPDGTLTADEVIDLNPTSASLIADVIGSVSQIATYSATVYLKAGVSTDNTCTFNVYTNGEDENNINVDFSTGTISGESGTNLVSSNIESVGSGWYRVTLIYNSLSSGEGISFRVWPNNRYNPSQIGSVYVWGAQLEEGSFPTSYIATSGSTATRNADSAEMTGTNFSSWYRQDEGTVYFDLSLNYVGSPASEISISDGTNNNRIMWNLGTSNQAPFISVNGSTQATMQSGSFSANEAQKLSLGYANNDIAVVTTSGSLVTDTSALIPRVDKLSLSNGAAGTTPFDGRIRKFAYYPKRLPNATLQALTEE